MRSDTLPRTLAYPTNDDIDVNSLLFLQISLEEKGQMVASAEHAVFFYDFLVNGRNYIRNHALLIG